MSNRLATLPAASATQAANVLRAWAASDETGFRAELDRTASLCSAQPSAAEEEKLDLLEAVAVTLLRMPVGDRGQPMAHVCIGLLAHLAGQGAGTEGVAWASEFASRC